MPTLVWMLLIFAAAALVLFLFWWRGNSVSHLVHTPLPPYEIPDVILVGGVLVENRGHAAAPNVKVAIHYNHGDTQKIHHMHVESEQPYILRAGGEQFNFATIRLRELGPGKKVFVYWATADEIQPQISVTTYRPSANFLCSDRGAPWLESLRALARRLYR